MKGKWSKQVKSPFGKTNDKCKWIIKLNIHSQILNLAFYNIQTYELPITVEFEYSFKGDLMRSKFSSPSQKGDSLYKKVEYEKSPFDS